MYDHDNKVIAVVDKGDQVTILDFYSGTDFGGIEVELSNETQGYIHYFQPETNYQIVKRED